MPHRIDFLVEWTIETGKTEAFKVLADQALQLVIASEPTTTVYNWHFNDAMNMAYSLETFTEQAAMELHLKNVFTLLKQMGKISKATRFEIFGDIDNVARERLSGIGAKVFPYWKGNVR